MNINYKNGFYTYSTNAKINSIFGIISYNKSIILKYFI